MPDRPTGPACCLPSLNRTHRAVDGRQDLLRLVLREREVRGAQRERRLLCLLHKGLHEARREGAGLGVRAGRHVRGGGSVAGHETQPLQVVRRGRRHGGDHGE
jgi:hypothetical protein